MEEKGRVFFRLRRERETIGSGNGMYGTVSNKLYVCMMFLRIYYDDLWKEIVILGQAKPQSNV